MRRTATFRFLIYRARTPVEVFREASGRLFLSTIIHRQNS